MNKYTSAILAILQYISLFVGVWQFLAIIVALLVSQNDVASSALGFQLTPGTWFWLGMKFTFGTVFIGIYLLLKKLRAKSSPDTPIDSPAD